VCVCARAHDRVWTLLLLFPPPPPLVLSPGTFVVEIAALLKSPNYPQSTLPFHFLILLCAHMCVRAMSIRGLLALKEYWWDSTPLQGLQRTLAPLSYAEGEQLELLLHDHYESRQSIDNRRWISKSPSRKRREEPKRPIGL